MQTESIAELVEFTPGVYGFRWLQHVAVFWVTGDGVILVDPCGEVNRRTPDVLKQAIGAVTDQPVKQVVYSHWGADHGIGGAVFQDTATFIAHANAVPRMQVTNDPASPLPSRTFDTLTTIELGDTKLDLHPANLQPTDDYLVIHDARRRVAMLVDIVQPKSAPYRNLLGHPDEVLRCLAWLRDGLDFEILISGHTTPRMWATKDDVAEQHQFYVDLSAAIESARAAGAADDSPEMVELVRASLAPGYGDWRRFSDLALNIEGMIGWRAGKNLRTT
ncbi:MAG: hypothetical protein AB7G21_01885 [Dehalococcoidia bacterium]